MKEFQLLVFIDDDHPTNIFHEIVVNEANITEKSIFFNSPVDALNYFKDLSQATDAVFPDAIFLDINMPELTGWEFLQAYEKIDIKQSPVIIMLTTSLLTYDLEQAKQMEIVYKLINKPLDIDLLRDLSKELLELNTTS